MSQFSDALSNLLKKYNITLYALARETEIERTLLTKIMNDTRALTVENFRRILESLQILCSEEAMLRELYVAEYYGKENLRNNLKMLSTFSRTESREANSDFLKVSMNSTEDTISFRSRQELVNIMDAHMGQAVCDGKKFERLYFNFDFDDAYKTMRKYSAHFVGSDFRLLVYFGSLNAEKFLEEALKYTDNSIPVRYLTRNEFSDPFPYFMVTDDCVLLANADLNNGVFVKNRVLSDAYAEKFLEAFDKAKPFVKYNDDVLALKDGYDTNNYALTDFDVEHRAFTSIFNVAQFLTMDMWEQVAKKDIPYREYLKSVVYEHYSGWPEKIKECTEIITESALTNFSRGGVLFQLPDNLANPLNAENRLEVMKTVKKYFSKEENKLYFFNDSCGISFDSPVCFENETKTDGNQSVQIGKSDLNAPVPFLGNIMVVMNDESVCEAIKGFFEIVTVSPYCRTQRESMKILDEEIKRLEMELGN